MPRPAPAALAENRHLAFRGEVVRAAARITPSRARTWLAARNPHGKSNADVLRRTLGAAGRERWIVDFPPEMDSREAALYTAPWRHLRRASAGRADAWRNPHAMPELRAALARRMRYLAAPHGRVPDFAWVEADVLPEDSLLVVARDDDFAHGLFAGRAFRVWWEAHAPHAAPERIVASFPWPWPPVVSGLSRTQEEAKFAVGRAARSGEVDALEAALVQAYALTAAASDEEWFDHLCRLHAARAKA